MRFWRVSSRFASVIHSTYSRLWLGLKASKAVLAFLFFCSAPARSAGTRAGAFFSRGARATTTPSSFSAIAL